MKRKPTPAQIAARERFAEMARSGAFTRSKTRKKNPLTYGLDGVVNITDTYERSVASSRGLAEHYANQLRMRGRDDIVYVVFGITPEAKAQAGRLRRGVTITLNPRDYEIAYAFHPTRGEISRELKAQRDAERRAYTRQGMTLKRNPAKKTVSQKISQLTREGYPQKQAVAIALSEQRAGKVKRNPISDVAQIIYQQLGANRFAAMTGSKNFVAGDDYLMFSIPKNASPFNKVRITLTPNDTYNMEFLKVGRLGDVSKTKVYEDVYADQLQELFRGLTGMETSLGTMGRRINPRASNPIILVSDKPKRVTRKSNPTKYRDTARAVPESRVLYSVHLATQRPSIASGGMFTSKQNAMRVAQVIADSTGKTYAVSRLERK